MKREIWKDKKGNLYEVEWGDLDDYCFYRSHPWTNKKYPRMWEGFLMIDKMLEENWSFVKALEY